MRGLMRVFIWFFLSQSVSQANKLLNFNKSCETNDLLWPHGLLYLVRTSRNLGTTAFPL